MQETRKNLKGKKAIKNLPAFPVFLRWEGRINFLFYFSYGLTRLNRYVFMVLSRCCPVKKIL